LTAAWLGQGTVYLLVRKRVVARNLAVVLVILSFISLGLMITAHITPEAVSYDVSQLASAQYKEILERNGATIVLTILLNVYGTIALVGGAIYSAYLFWRKKVLAKRMVGNILIAAGALMPAMAGSFIKAGLVDWLYVSELIGVILMYAGFLLAIVERTPEGDVMTPASLE
jgi:vacuolar-type H+-ATPase subunit I/STV1